MSRECGRRSPERGFTLPEVLISLFSVAIILILSGQMLFATRRASQRQQFQVEARQTARAAVEYVAFMLRGSADMNMTGGNATSLMMWFWYGVGGTGLDKPCPGTDGCYQASYDNVQDATLADLNTDVITFARPDNVQQISAVKWTSYHDAKTVAWAPPFGCPDNSTALQYFKDVTGHTGGSPDVSHLMLLADSVGGYAFYQITGYGAASCTPACQDADGVSRACVSTTSYAGDTSGINPPGLQPTLQPPVTLMAGTRFYSLRVHNGWLEQKDGIFDPRSDNPGASFVQVLPNVEDLQIVYLFKNGDVRNGPDVTLPNAQSKIPAQIGSGGVATAHDATNVIGVRITVTGRSASPFPLEQARFKWPDAENHSATAASKSTDTFYRFQASQIAMMRNRSTGS